MELPEEAGAKPDQIGKLDNWLYWFRPAAAAWENHYAGKLEEAGFVRGVSTPVSFYHPERDISLVVHGDDFTFVGEQEHLEWVIEQMKSWYQIKVRARLGPEEGDDKQAVLLGRIVRWHEWGISCEADPKYRRRILEALGLGEGSKCLSSPGVREEDGKDSGATKRLGEDKVYRGIVATVNYLATDQPDLQFASKEACRDMSAPDERSWGKLKRIGRYLLGRQQVVWQYPWKEGLGGWTVTVDSDWAGDRDTRKSTSGGIIRLGSHCIKTWSITQSSPALSSCEAEYYALVDGATRALGIRTAARELGIVSDELVVEAQTDSSAAKAYASRRGAGRIRHIEVRWLWLQQAVVEGRIRLTKLPGTSNPADILTKYKAFNDYREQLRAVSVEVVGNAPGHGREEIGWLRLGSGIRWADAAVEGGEESSGGRSVDGPALWCS